MERDDNIFHYDHVLLPLFTHTFPSKEYKKKKGIDAIITIESIIITTIVLVQCSVKMQSICFGLLTYLIKKTVIVNHISKQLYSNLALQNMIVKPCIFHSVWRESACKCVVKRRTLSDSFTRPMERKWFRISCNSGKGIP